LLACQDRDVKLFGVGMVIELGAQTVVDALSNAVRNEVLTGDLPAGSRVTEHEVAARYGVARPTAKAAIERVVQMGILRRTANKTARVPLLSSSDIADLYRSRIFFERDVVVQLAERSIVPEPAERALESMKRAIEANSLPDAVGSDIGFHTALVNGLGSTRISRMYDTIVGEAHLCMAQEQSVGVIEPEHNYTEHLALLDAIRSGNKNRAESLLLKHLTGAAERLAGHQPDATQH
jgi:DNA-binding GntR family transcriptional regulator